MLDLANFSHTGLIVPSLDEALAEHKKLGVRFASPLIVRRTAHGPDGPIEMDIRACYGMPPSLLEIVQEMPGTIWEAGERGRLHHLGFKTQDFEAESEALSAAGWPRVAWGDVGWVYHETPFGYYVELLSPELVAAQQEMFN